VQRRHPYGEVPASQRLFRSWRTWRRHAVPIRHRSRGC